jgi:hypothetical protein
MPAPEEQGYELSHVRMSDGGAAGIDPPRARDRPAAGSAEDLAQRQNRLLPGHPSSRFEDDGTPRPPLVPLKNLELPEPGEDREHNGAGREQAARNGRPGSGAENGQADRGAWADPPGKEAGGAPESAVTKPDVWASADRETDTSESVDPQQQARESADQEQESEDQPGNDADAEAADTEAADTEDADVEDAGTTDADTADAGTAAADTADADLADAQHATLDDEPIADNPAPAGTTEARRAEALTPEQVRIAVRAHGRCRLAEGRSVFGTYGESGLTPAMRRIEDELDHGTLVPDTEKYALKSLDRFQEKLANLIVDEPDKSAEEHAAEIHDGVRYTFLFDHDTYTQNFKTASNSLEAAGFTLTVLKNSWDDGEYKGVNTRWIDSESSSPFEIQFHTQKSWDAKQQSHETYEKINKLQTPASEREQLRDYQREISRKVAQPPGWREITDYRREGY